MGCPNQLDRQPCPQAQGGSWSYRRGKEEQGSRKGPQAQPQLLHLEEAQHPLPPSLPLNGSIEHLRLTPINLYLDLGSVFLSTLVLWFSLSSICWERFLERGYKRERWSVCG